MEIRKSNGRPEPPPTRGTARAHTVDFNGTNTPQSRSESTSLQQGNGMARKLIVPPYNSSSPISSVDGSMDTTSGVRRASSNASVRSLPSLPIRHLPPPHTSSPQPSNLSQQLSRKPAPPVAKKPSHLATTLSPTSTPSPPPPQQEQQQRYRIDPEPANGSRPQPPPPRRSIATSANVLRKPAPNLIDDDRPPLPPRTGTESSMESNSRGRRGGGMNLLDDEPSEDLEALKGWEVLRPSK